MTLQNLWQIGRLKAHSTTPAEIQRLLAAAGRNLRDAAQTTVSEETRFDAGYKAVMQCALAAMMVSGFRPSTSEPGHHVTLIQSLPLTLGVDANTWVLLDALRRKRNANDYTGDVVTTDMVEECRAQGQRLIELLLERVRQTQPMLLEPQDRAGR